MRQVQGQAKKSQSHACKLGSGSELGRHRTGHKHTCSTVQAEVKSESLSLKAAPRNRGIAHCWICSWPEGSIFKVVPEPKQPDPGGCREGTQGPENT